MRAEIEQLWAQLLAQQDEQLLAQQQLEQASTDRLKRSGKLPDPPLLTNNKEPTYENWKLEIKAKLQVNADHFDGLEARMAYVFSRTGGDAKTHLQSQYDEESADPFTSVEGMISHLGSIY